MSLKVIKIYQYPCLYPYKYKYTALRTGISTNVCKGFSIVPASAFHSSIGTHVCKGFSIVIVLTMIAVFC